MFFFISSYILFIVFRIVLPIYPHVFSLYSIIFMFIFIYYKAVKP
jgi:hypothetical protein